jgi:hypothetical protein
MIIRLHCVARANLLVLYYLYLIIKKIAFPWFGPFVPRPHRFRPSRSVVKLVCFVVPTCIEYGAVQGRLFYLWPTRTNPIVPALLLPPGAKPYHGGGARLLQIKDNGGGHSQEAYSTVLGLLGRGGGRDLSDRF